MKKLLAILFIASAGAVLFAQEATPPESGETQGTSTRPFFIDRNNDGICDNCGYSQNAPGENYGGRHFLNNRNYCNMPGTGKHCRFAPDSERNCPVTGKTSFFRHGHGGKNSFCR